MKQLTLSNDLKRRVVHGGELSVGVRKVARPIATKQAMHLVMRSTQARGTQSFLAPSNVRWIQAAALRLARLYQVQIYDFANSGNHLHFLLRAKTRGGFKSFLRVLTGLIAMKVGRSGKGRRLNGKFWDLPAFTRIVAWGKAFKVARKYVVQNTLEALGMIPHAPRKSSPAQIRTGPIG